MDESERRRVAALREWGCPRPDKHHHLTQEHAQERLDRVAATSPVHDTTACVYRCRCGGWVWGRPRTETHHENDPQ